MTGADNDDGRWSIMRLAVMLYPFVMGAVAINLFLLGLMWQAIGWPALSPVMSVILGIPLSFPASWASARWVRGLMDEADGR